MGIEAQLRYLAQQSDVKVISPLGQDNYTYQLVIPWCNQILLWQVIYGPEYTTFKTPDFLFDDPTFNKFINSLETNPQVSKVSKLFRSYDIENNQYLLNLVLELKIAFNCYQLDKLNFSNHYEWQQQVGQLDLTNGGQMYVLEDKQTLKELFIALPLQIGYDSLRPYFPNEDNTFNALQFRVTMKWRANQSVIQSDVVIPALLDNLFINVLRGPKFQVPQHTVGEQVTDYLNRLTNDVQNYIDGFASIHRRKKEFLITLGHFFNDMCIDMDIETFKSVTYIAQYRKNQVFIVKVDITNNFPTTKPVMLLIPVWDHVHGKLPNLSNYSWNSTWDVQQQCRSLVMTIQQALKKL